MILDLDQIYAAIAQTVLSITVEGRTYTLRRLTLADLVPIGQHAADPAKLRVIMRGLFDGDPPDVLDDRVDADPEVEAQRETKGAMIIWAVNELLEAQLPKNRQALVRTTIQARVSELIVQESGEASTGSP